MIRFTPEHVSMASIALNEPQIWCKLDASLFEVYQVESLRDNIISLEINVASFFQVLRNFEKAESGELSIRLQRKSADGSSSGACLGIYYTEQISMASSVSHSFHLPIRFLKKENDERINEPELSKVNVLMKLEKDLTVLFKRIERFRHSEYMTVTASQDGSLQLAIRENDRKLVLKWKEKLQVQDASSSQASLGESASINVKIRDWKPGSRLCEVCSNVVLIVAENEASVFHSFLDEGEKCEIVYYINAVNDNNL